MQRRKNKSFVDVFVVAFFFSALKCALHRLKNAIVLQLTETKLQLKEGTSTPYLLVQQDLPY